MFTPELLQASRDLVAALRAAKIKLATAESCTGGLIAALLTEIPGSSVVFDRGFVTYSNEAKVEAIGVRRALIDKHGAVSPEVAVAMAEGVLAHSKADVAIAVTGVAGPGGGTDDKPVGLVYLSVLRRGQDPITKEYRFGVASRTSIRLAAVGEGLSLARRVIS